MMLLAGCGGWPFRGVGIKPPGRPQPEPPGSGPAEPGSAQYAHARVATTRLGSGPEEVFIYEPGDPTPASAPVIVFLHGHTVTNPMGYGAWIDHLVRRGNIVLYPVYQVDLGDPLDYSANALIAVQNAYA